VAFVSVSSPKFGDNSTWKRRWIFSGRCFGHGHGMAGQKPVFPTSSRYGRKEMKLIEITLFTRNISIYNIDLSS